MIETVWNNQEKGARIIILARPFPCTNSQIVISVLVHVALDAVYQSADVYAVDEERKKISKKIIEDAKPKTEFVHKNRLDILEEKVDKLSEMLDPEE